MSAVGVGWLLRQDNIYTVATHCESCSVLFLLFWLHAAHKRSIHDVFPAFLGDVIFAYELDCVGGILDLISNSLANRLNLFADDCSIAFRNCL